MELPSGFTVCKRLHTCARQCQLQDLADHLYGLRIRGECACYPGREVSKKQFIDPSGLFVG
jgi:hypothetical protein